MTGGWVEEVKEVLGILAEMGIDPVPCGIGYQLTTISAVLSMLKWTVICALLEMMEWVRSWNSRKSL